MTEPASAHNMDEEKKSQDHRYTASADRQGGYALACASTALSAGASPADHLKLSAMSCAPPCAGFMHGIKLVWPMVHPEEIAPKLDFPVLMIPTRGRVNPIEETLLSCQVLPQGNWILGAGTFEIELPEPSTRSRTSLADQLRHDAPGAEACTVPEPRLRNLSRGTTNAINSLAHKKVYSPMPMA